MKTKRKGGEHVQVTLRNTILGVMIAAVVLIVIGAGATMYW